MTLSSVNTPPMLHVLNQFFHGFKKQDKESDYTNTRYKSHQVSTIFLKPVNVPVQFCPSPVYPGLQLQTYDPCVLLHVAFT